MAPRTAIGDKHPSSDSWKPPSGPSGAAVAGRQVPSQGVLRSEACVQATAVKWQWGLCARGDVWQRVPSATDWARCSLPAVEVTV